jgi:MFS family permease
MVAECMVFIVGVVIQLCSFHVWQQFAVGRFVSGLGVGALSAAVPMASDHPYPSQKQFCPDPIMSQYQAETAPAQIRGTLT